MKSSIHDQVLALAGIYQAVKLVQQTARGERRDPVVTQTCFSSILVTDPASASEVYGDTSALLPGLEILLGQLANDNQQRDLELTGYVITLMHIERKLIRLPNVMETLSRGIESIKRQLDSLDESVETLSGELADLYHETISNIQPRVMIKGDESVLRNTDSQRVVRALLLAAVRSVVLWRQCGGSRLRLILQRGKLVDGCQALLTSIQKS